MLLGNKIHLRINALNATRNAIFNMGINRYREVMQIKTAKKLYIGSQLPRQIDRINDIYFVFPLAKERQCWKFHTCCVVLPEVVLTAWTGESI